MTSAKNRPAPLDTREGKQKDDNIDDLGRRTDGSTLDQPVDAKPGKSGGDKEKRQTAGS